MSQDPDLSAGRRKIICQYHDRGWRGRFGPSTPGHDIGQGSGVTGVFMCDPFCDVVLGVICSEVCGESRSFGK